MIIQRTILLVPVAMGDQPPFPDLKGGGLLAFQSERIVARVTAVPTEFIRGFDSQVEGIVIGSIHKDDLRAKDEQLRHLRLRRRLGRKDDGFLSDRRSHASQCGSRVARGSRDHNLGFQFTRARHNHGAGSVFEGSRWVTGLILQPEMFQVQFLRQPWHGKDRGPAGGVQRRGSPFRLSDRQKRQVAPQGGFLARGDILQLELLSDGIIIKNHIEIPAIFRACVCDLPRQIFSSTNRAFIASEF